MQREIQEAAYQFQKDVENEDRIVVGVNKFVTNETARGELLRVDPQVREEQKSALAQLRAGRDAGAVQSTLADLEKAARSDENLMPRVLACVKAYATLGEICDRLREVFGEYRAPTTI